MYKYKYGLFVFTLILLCLTKADSITSKVFAVDPDSDDYPPAEWMPAHTANYYSLIVRPEPQSIKRIIIHTMQGYYTGRSTLNRPHYDPKKSWHYTISKDGLVTQHVREQFVAWHAIRQNVDTIGIEHEGFVSDCSWYTEEMYQSSANLVRHLADKYNIPKDRQHILSHSELAHNNHTDPGPCWNWDYYMQLVEGVSERDYDEEPASPTGHFADIPFSHEFYRYIETLYALNEISDNNMYYPDDDLTRGQLAKIIINSLENEYRQYDDGECAFPDVCPSHTFYDYIRRLKELGIVGGYSDGTFRPDAKVTRGESATFIIRSRGESPNFTDCVTQFTDVNCDSPHYDNIRRLKEVFDRKSSSLGFTDGSYRPDNIISRGGISKLVVIGLDLENGVTPLSGGRNG